MFLFTGDMEPKNVLNVKVDETKAPREQGHFKP
jgi:hypothetical protein